MRTVVALLAAAAALASWGCGGAARPGGGGAVPVLGPLPARPGPCRSAARAPAPRSRTAAASIGTACGTFEVALDVREQPRTVASFEHLARRGAYAGTSFDRIVHAPDGGPFVVEGGGDDARFRIVEAPPSDAAAYPRGTVAMARRLSQPAGASGTRLFVVLAPRMVLPPDYAILGHVTSGAAVLARISDRPSDPSTARTGRPVRIESVTIGR